MSLISNTPPLSQTQRRLLWGLLLFAVLLAWNNRFIQDDAFISLRYAANWVTGQGLVFNPDEYVEGYSNFLWTLILAVPLWLELEPVGFSYALGLLLFAANLWLSFSLARRLLGNNVHALWVMLLLGTNYSFSCYATGGLETQLQSLLFTAALMLSLSSLFKPRFPFPESVETSSWAALDLSWQTLSLFSLIAALAVMTRLDSVVFLLPLGIALVLRILSQRNKLQNLLALCTPAGLLLGAWMAWKLSYYGILLPNTYYAKVAAVPAYVLLYQGAIFLGSFMWSYGLLPIIMLAIFSLQRRHLLHHEQRPLLLLSLALLLWLVYVLKVGGDFMEFRFLVPILPAGAIFTVWLMQRCLHNALLRYLLLGFLIASSLHHAKQFNGINGINSIGDLRAFIENERTDLAGQVLGVLFADSPTPVRIATVAAGIIPYYSKLYTLDMFGLNDAYIARHGIPFHNKPGHYRLATLEHLQQREINLVLGVPRLRKAQASFNAAYGGLSGFLVGSYMLAAPFDAQGKPQCDLNQLRLATRLPAWLPHIQQNTLFCPPQHLPAGSRILEIPINEQRVLTMLYLNPHPAIEAAIARYHLPVYQIAQ